MNTEQNDVIAQPVDVLAKIDAAIKVAEFSGADRAPPRNAAGLRAARAAVAELIAAADKAVGALHSQHESERLASAHRLSVAVLSATGVMMSGAAGVKS